MGVLGIRVIDACLDCLATVIDCFRSGGVCEPSKVIFTPLIFGFFAGRPSAALFSKRTVSSWNLNRCWPRPMQGIFRRLHLTQGIASPSHCVRHVNNKAAHTTSSGSILNGTGPVRPSKSKRGTADSHFSSVSCKPRSLCSGGHQPLAITMS